MHITHPSSKDRVVVTSAVDNMNDAEQEEQVLHKLSECTLSDQYDIDRGRSDRSTEQD